MYFKCTILTKLISSMLLTVILTSSVNFLMASGFRGGCHVAALGVVAVVSPRRVGDQYKYLRGWGGVFVRYTYSQLR